MERPVLERQFELLLLGRRETAKNHLGVGEEDAVEGEAGELYWVVVHFFFLLSYIKLIINY